LKTGTNNLITDIKGLYVGNADNDPLKSGVTVLTGDKPFTAAVDVRGGAPGTRETDLLAPDKLVEAIDAIVLSGGSAFGLDAASGVMDAWWPVFVCHWFHRQSFLICSMAVIKTGHPILTINWALRPLLPDL